MPKRERTKFCDHCEKLMQTAYRVQFDQSAQWHLICPACWAEVSHQNPDYRYGGTWKARKRQ